MYNWPNGWVSKAFDPPLVKKTNFRRFSRKRVNFELQLPHSLLFLFPKIISRYISIYLIRETPKVLQDSTPRYKRSLLPFWPHFETGIRNSKKKSKKMKSFALCHYMWPSFHECRHNIDHLPWKPWIFIHDSSFLRTLS